jgi:transposase
VIATDIAYDPDSYQDLSREELIELVKQYQQLVFNNQQLKHELDQLKRLVFGSRHERFIPATSPQQLALGLNVPQSEQPVVTSTQNIQYTRTITQSPKKESPGCRMKLPADLPRVEVVIEPTEDVSGCKQIGNEITEELEYTPGNFYVRKIVRPKYARVNGEGVAIGTLPARIIDKGIAGPGLLAQIVIDKYVDHLPLYRQIERFKRAGIALPISTVTDWVSHCCKELEVLYETHRMLVLNSGYLEGDETTIKVLDKDKKGKTHLGYYWVYRAPVENLVLFDYRQGRGGAGPKDC